MSCAQLFYVIASQLMCGYFEVTILGEFSAAHQLKNYDGNCSSIHGHNWKVEVTLRGKALDQSGILYDFRTLKKSLKEFTNKLDHSLLNDLSELKNLSPSAENISYLIATELIGKINTAEASLYRVRVWENDRSFASYYPRLNTKFENRKASD